MCGLLGFLVVYLDKVVKFKIEKLNTNFCRLVFKMIKIGMVTDNDQK